MKKTIIIIILIVVAVGLWFWFANRDWYRNPYLTYHNTKHGFSLEYHPDWYKAGDAESDFVQFRNVAQESGDGGVPLGVQINIFVAENTESLTLNQWRQQINVQQGEKLAEEMLQTEEIMLGGRKAIKEIEIPLPGLVEAGAPISVYVAHGNYIITLTYLGREPDYSDNMKVWQHALASFNFD